MERLTHRSPALHNAVSYGACECVECCRDCENCKIGAIISKLCAYEETGLTPEEIKELSDVRQERDEAIEDIPHTCEYCAHNDVDADVAPCADCEQMNTLFGEERWEWRGMKEM